MLIAVCRNLDGKTPLHEAAQAGQLAAAEYLLSRGAKVQIYLHCLTRIANFVNN
jgi:ankyrin repeat protein